MTRTLIVRAVEHAAGAGTMWTRIGRARVTRHGAQADIYAGQQVEISMALPEHSQAAGYELTEHTADVGIHSWGASAADVFEQAALAMLSLMYDLGQVRPIVDYPFEAEAQQLDLLLAASLNELLYIVEAQRVVVARICIEALEDQCGRWSLRGRAEGEAIDPARHSVRGVVKAATLHRLALTESGGRWEGTVLLDA